MSSNRKMMLKSSDGEAFEVDELVALESQTIKHMIEDECADNGIPLPNVTSKILSKVIEYCKKHVDASVSEDRTATGVDDELKAWDAEFVKVDQATLFDLVHAADYLNIKSLLYLTCQTVADMIKGKTPEKIRKIFNIIDCTPEEQEEILPEIQWAFGREETLDEGTGANNPFRQMAVSIAGRLSELEGERLLLGLGLHCCTHCSLLATPCPPDLEVLIAHQIADLEGEETLDEGTGANNAFIQMAVSIAGRLSELEGERLHLGLGLHGGLLANPCPFE